VSSCLLFHGPGAKMAACGEAARIGYLLVPPVGDEGRGLKVAEAREVVSLLQSTPLGTRRAVVVVGPMDGTATLKSSDALLKTVEEGGSGYVTPLLWANDLGEVPGTIRSRCLDRWAPNKEPDVIDDNISSAAWSVVHAAVKGDQATAIDGLRIIGGKKAPVGVFLQVVAECLSDQLDNERSRALWDRVRMVTMKRDPTFLEVVTAFAGF